MTAREREKILIVDDDMGVLAALEAELEDHYEVTAVTSVGQALAHLQCCDFAAIVSDVRMPGVDGLSLIGQCAIRYPNMVRIILTAFDGEDVNETALGPNGAYKLLKPWGDDLLITLQNALKQRQDTVELRRHLDLKSELLDLDRRLHSATDLDELLHQTALEMMRIPEVIAVASYTFEDDGAASLHDVHKRTDGESAPELRRAHSAPVMYQGQYIYSVPVGDWVAPWAALALKLSSAHSDAIRYLDFIGRQAYRTLQILKTDGSQRRPTGVPPQFYFDETRTISAGWMLEKLTTPATVLASAHHTFDRLIGDLKENCLKDGKKISEFNELTELNGDLGSISRNLSSLLDHLRKVNEDGDDTAAVQA
ncbi:MAG: response regulator [Myxococcota bacterium]|nr:response regulator [Myxococcota bacterium]